jgi:acid phosphatase (class A)
MKNFSKTLFTSIISTSTWTWMLIATPTLAGWDVPEEKLFLDPPPATGSLIEKKDYEVLFTYQEERTQAECREANRHTFASMKVLFGPDLGILNEDEFEHVRAFGNKLVRNMALYGHSFKREFARLRPYDNNEEIKPCILKPTGQLSYPSSHAAIGWILGEVLAEIYPDRAEELRGQGLRIGELRVLGGVHHPSDVEAGRKLAAQVLKLLKKDAEFSADFEALK